jgi:hypothetical protein
VVLLLLFVLDDDAAIDAEITTPFASVVTLIGDVRPKPVQFKPSLPKDAAKRAARKVNIVSPTAGSAGGAFRKRSLFARNLGGAICE